MQIDFHHAVTYVLARWAGFDHSEAETIAYAAQYVDDATYTGAVEFKGGQKYCRTASAYTMKDVKNLIPIENVHSWVPFHFLPGNGGYDIGQTPPIKFSEQMLCIHNSKPAKHMLNNCILNKESDFGGLHLLGITMHVYADTWAHQGFAGIHNEINSVHNLDAIDILNYKELKDKGWAFLAPNIGHGSASSYPDRPFLRWRYNNHAKLPIERNNTDECLDAAQHMLEFMTKYNSSPKATQVHFDKVKDFLKENFIRIGGNDEKERHRCWIGLIEQGVPHLDGTALYYYPDGDNSWKWKAVGDLQALHDEGKSPEYTPAFLESDWKKFHDALQYHRLYVLNVLLPKYGICAG